MHTTPTHTDEYRATYGILGLLVFAISALTYAAQTPPDTGVADSFMLLAGLALGAAWFAASMMIKITNPRTAWRLDTHWPVIATCVASLMVTGMWMISVETQAHGWGIIGAEPHQGPLWGVPVITISLLVVLAYKRIRAECQRYWPR